MTLRSRRWKNSPPDSAARTLRLRRVGGDERIVTLGPKYLDSRRPSDNGPALDYAYAVTKFGAQGKTVDRAYPLLDAASSQEQESVALSRGREVANVYVVASSELVDPELGPGRRELSDELHDIRDAIEREGNDFPATEVTLRKEIDGLSSKGLAARRAALVAAARAADPVLSRRDRLERAIEESREWIGRLKREREAIEAMRHQPAEELARVRSAEAGQAKLLRRDLAELERLPASTTAADPKPLDPATRLEAALIEKRIERNVRREVRASQLDPSQVIYSALGPFPVNDPDKAVAWDNAAHTIATYRHRHDIQDKANPLGTPPRGASARAERTRAQRHIEEVQRHLGRTADRSAQHTISQVSTTGH